jgi:hypothetical protein
MHNLMRESPTHSLTHRPVIKHRPDCSRYTIILIIVIMTMKNNSPSSFTDFSILIPPVSLSAYFPALSVSVLCFMFPVTTTELHLYLTSLFLIFLGKNPEPDSLSMCLSLHGDQMGEQRGWKPFDI